MDTGPLTILCLQDFVIYTVGICLIPSRLLLVHLGALSQTLMA